MNIITFPNSPYILRQPFEPDHRHRPQCILQIVNLIDNL